ncbi:hypothetical protein BJ944DRAFT_227745 [Cunninghamella echinulata]|nr:hypothetical protein BJ944DRAFT_227745 [Cunninghamella echinulata]
MCNVSYEGAIYIFYCEGFNKTNVIRLSKKLDNMKDLQLCYESNPTLSILVLRLKANKLPPVLPDTLSNMFIRNFLQRYISLIDIFSWLLLYSKANIFSTVYLSWIPLAMVFNNRMRSSSLQ